MENIYKIVDDNICVIIKKNSGWICFFMLKNTQLKLNGKYSAMPINNVNPKHKDYFKKRFTWFPGEGFNTTLVPQHNDDDFIFWASTLLASLPLMVFVCSNSTAS